MRSTSSFVLLPLAAAGLVACSSPNSEGTAEESAAEEQATPPYKPVASVVDLMRGVITTSAEQYWESVSVVVDFDGVHENAPETPDEWLDVWAAGMTLAETGNLLMMPPRALDDPEWIRYSTALVDVGFEAAQVARARDFEGVLAMGEQIYNLCNDCHTEFVPALPDL